MAIRVPGKRDRHGRLKIAARTAVATLSLTAMVDMFTVLVVFLLMNYQSTGEVLPMKENVDLPQASSVDELEPANVVVVGPDGIELNGEKFETFDEVKASQDWILPRFKKALEAQIEEDRKEREESVSAKIQEAVKQAKAPDAKSDYIAKKVTIQADKKTDILSLKKVMYTITEAGGDAINFAVLKVPGENAGEE
ncbi:MAG: ExbD/TolR family protein [Bdellovibrionales bacterium]